ncbi:uncharacterized protein AMSG_08325 [Thecamonas trahens ATCC 50062]|uniref:Uncharacterized protein n=1 Tax=Thecamonas trahens ATCC 50062 TaxID=461836 RepID=A0A0L0DLT1_THETB|nr:hypothetical protein AMSG_08325 [Thecamonas trahens ATCC 50062]KNC52353.1 hypothetical protein AMSG_08325 [Thecamonas trahens ATCC 50062]|eukprot:XP_013755402.1 hypothetical protein AMSG_08325 [Thecamonas trahens ATCC 50062]
MINAFRQTLPGIQAWHDRYYRSGGSSSSIGVDGTVYSLNLQTHSERSLKDPRMGSAGLFTLSHTAYSQEWHEATVEQVLFPPYDLAAVAEVEVAGVSSPIHWYASTPDYDSGRTTIVPLSGITAKVVYADSVIGMTLHSVIPSYAGPGWSGAIDDATAEFPGSPRSLVLRIEDVSMPPRRGYPEMVGFNLVFAGAALVIAAVFLTCPLMYLCYVARRNMALNTGRPPPFFGSLRRFRGWG